MAEEVVTAESLKQMLIDILQPTGNSSGQDPAGKTKGNNPLGGPTFVGSLGDLEKTIKSLNTKLDELAKNVGINTDAVRQIPAAILGYRSSEAPSKAFQDAANLFGTGVGNFVRHLDALRQQAQTNSNVGIGEGDPRRQRAQFQAAGYEDNAAGLKGVTDAAGNFRGSLAGLGYSANDATQKFLDYSAKLRESPAISELIEKNIITAADVPRLAMIAAQGQTKALETPESREKLVQAMAKEATMINQISSAYGINRDKLIDNAIAMNENNDSQIRQAALGDDAARRAMRNAQTISQPSGKTMEELVAKLSSGARLSKEDRAYLSVGTMGMGGQLTAAVKETQRTKNLAMNDPQKVAAEENLARVQAEIRARQASPEANRLANSMKEGTNQSVLKKAIEESRPAAKIEENNRDRGAFTPEQAAKNAQQNAGGAQLRGEQQQFSGADEPKKASGAKVFETVAELTETYSKNAAAASGALAKLNEELGRNVELIDLLKKGLAAPVGPNSESVKEKEAKIQQTIDVLKGMMDTSRTNLPNNSNVTPGGDIRPVNVTTPSVNVTSPSVTVTGATPGQPTGQPASRLDDNGNIKPKPVTETRGTGTLGETGSPTEMKDVIAKLHKGETVLTPDQMKNLISGASMMSASEIVSSLLSGMSGNKGTGGIDMNKSLGSVTTNVSAASTPQLTSETIYTGTLKALKELSISTLPANSASTTPPPAKKETASTQMESYTIKAGDTLSKIAKDTGISIQDIMKANASNPAIKDKDTIYAGKELKLPVLKPPTIPAPSTNSEAAAELLRESRRGTPPPADYAALKAQYDKMSISPTATVEGLATLKAQMEGAMKNQAVPAPSTNSEAAAELLRESRRGTQPATSSTNTVQNPAQKQQAAAFDYATLKAQYDKMATSPAATVEGLATLKTQMDAAIKNQPATVAPIIPPVTIPEVKIPTIPPVTAAVPKALTPVTKPDETGSIIDKQLAKFGIDIGSLSGKLPNVLPTSATTNPVSVSEIQKYMSEGMSQSDAQKKATKTTLEPVAAFTPGASIKKIFDSVSTTISAVTGGGSTTRKSVQNDDAKAAEKQLAVLTSQYKSDRAAINDVIREKLGPEAKGIDVIRAMRDNPQAKALEDRLKVASESLNNRIGAGTSTETTFESGIQRGNIVVPQSTSVPITDAMKGFDPVLGEYEKEEGDEEPKTINLNDSEPKTKDLHDQLIKLNSSILQLVEHSASGVGLAESQIKATRSLSGNRFA